MLLVVLYISGRRVNDQGFFSQNSARKQGAEICACVRIFEQTMSGDLQKLESYIRNSEYFIF